MKPNGSGVRPLGFVRIAEFGLELAVSLEPNGDLIPLVRLYFGGSIDTKAPWFPARMFVALAKSAQGLVDLIDAGALIVSEPTGPAGPRLLDALGGPLPESAP